MICSVEVVLILFKIGGAFVHKLEDEQGEFVQYEFVKSIGQNICHLNLYGNKEPSGENIHHMCKQGPIYVRASKTLKVWALSELESNLDGTSEKSNETEDEVTVVSVDSSSDIDSHATGIKRRRQSTLSFTSQANEFVPQNTDIHQYASCNIVGNNSTSASGVPVR